ncbi:MAG: DUF6298 domain-containing protein [Prevotellaceae bacterium]|nr:DUF6298 domain-containing protein [Prevotellaceae bacterium]
MKTKTSRLLFAALFSIVFSLSVDAATKPRPQLYVPMDYSTCGYHASEQALPQYDFTYRIENDGSSDYSGIIQQAIDKISSVKPNKIGIRGAILLGEGRFDISKPIRISASGVILCGSGRDKTVIVKHGADRGAAIYIEGGKGTYSEVENYKSGDRIGISWTGDAEWIAAHNCDDFGGRLSYTGWKEGDINLIWNRTVVDASGDSIVLDAPITMFGCKNKVKKGDFPMRLFDASKEINECGIANISVESAKNNWNPKDEDHCWTGIHIDNARDCWVSMVNFRHFSGSAVNIQRGGSRITVEDCIASEPVSEIGGWRRDVFITRGQQTLFQRCVSREGIHDFAAGYCAAGPNAFVQCEGENSLGFSGSIGAWAPGLLFDIVNIDGNDICIMNLEQFRTGTGWNSGNTLVWQCTASNIKCYSPDAENRNSGHGCWGALWGNAEWTSSNDHVSPRSIFYAQLEQRMKSEGKDMAVDGRILMRSTDATTSPTVEQAERMAQESLTTPRLTLEAWIAQHDNAAINATKIPLFKYKAPKEEKKELALEPLSRNKMTSGVPWWNGRIKDSWVKKSARPAITRFVPGYEGTGWTDNLDDVVNYLDKRGFGSLYHHYGLWYDIRRTDHERIRRADGNVEPPFYEQPFARSGVGTAWDGLSRYDLTKPNLWYWERLKEFAQKAAEKNIYLFNNMYFQHNILEAGAHWVDCPWRPVNNINETNFPEPVPFAGDKRIFMAEQFYNEQDPVLRPLHKQYIRMCLEQLKDQPNVVHFISAEYTGPLHFTRFWLETIAEWEAETGLHPLVAISCTKDAQDALLEDPKLGKIIDVIDIRYWHYSDKGLWAPEAGKNMAPRQWQRKFPIGKTSKADIDKAVNEYQERYPDKVVIYNGFAM